MYTAYRGKIHGSNLIESVFMAQKSRAASPIDQAHKELRIPSSLLLTHLQSSPVMSVPRSVSARVYLKCKSHKSECFICVCANIAPRSQLCRNILIEQVIYMSVSRVCASIYRSACKCTRMCAAQLYSTVV